MVFRSLRHIFTTVLVLLSLVTGVQAAVQVRVTPAATTTLAGSTITLTVEADSVTDLGGFQFGFNYNPANLQAVTATINPAFDQTITQNLRSGNGLIAATVFNNAPVSGSPVILATIDFTVLTAASASVSLTNVILGQLGGTEIPSTSSGATIISDSFTISAIAGTGGTITPAGLSNVLIGSILNYAITPNTWFHIAGVTVDGTPQGPISSYSFTGVTASHTIDATFAPDVVSGVCGTSSGSAFKTTPTTNLCSIGTATAVSGTGPWSWSCGGINGGSAVPCNGVVDTTGPALTISTLANGTITNNAILNVSGTVSDASGVAGLTINGANVTVTGNNFSYPVILLDGANSVTSIATNTFGNSTTDNRTITLDTAAPVLTVTTPADNSKTAQPVALITGTVDKTSTTTIALNSGTPLSASMVGNAYSATVNLAAGLNNIAITATDLAGNTTNAARTLTYDNTNPSLAITNPGQDITTAQSSLIITGTVSDTITSVVVTISLNGQTLSPTVTNGTFSQLLTFPGEGTWPVVVTATDEAGNRAIATRNIIYAPPVLFTLPDGILDSANTTGTPRMNDALIALSFAMGEAVPTPEQLRRGDASPMINGVPHPDGKIDLGDVLVILRRIVGLTR
jgi:hypothetical protein